MKARYVLAPEAAQDLVRVWRYLAVKAGTDVADRAEATIRNRILFLARTPGAGHFRRDLTTQPVKFFAV